MSIASLPRHAVVKAPQSIRLEGLTRIFQGGVRAVDDVDLAVAPGEFLVLVGPSGCGKSTLLRMVAGLEEVTDGTVFVGDQDVTDLAPRERDIAMVFQNYALYPHMSVRRNLEHPLRMQHVPKDKRDERVRSAAAMLGLGELLERRPTALSGGQRQRVAMGRAIVREPKAFLMDEPLSNLDAKLRVSMRAELRALHERLGTTTLYVTHDQVEAMTLGHRVAVMREGKIVQLGTPQDLYRDPTDLFVAAFVGSPAMNLLHARRDGEHLAFGQHRLQLDGRLPDDQTFVCGIRPEHIADASYAPATWPRVDAEIALVEDVGSVINVAFLVDARPADVVEEADPTHHVTTVIAALDHRSTPRPGKSMTLAFDPSEFHYFQPGGERIARTSR